MYFCIEHDSNIKLVWKQLASYYLKYQWKRKYQSIYWKGDTDLVICSRSLMAAMHIEFQKERNNDEKCIDMHRIFYKKLD